VDGLAARQHVLALGRFECVRIWSTSGPPTAENLLRERAFAPVEVDGVHAGSGGLLVRELDDTRGRPPLRLGSRNPLDIDDWDLRMIYSMAG
jgi:hypothetical protein